MDPLFSVIIPMHNSEKYIGQCLESVLNQEEKSYEVVVVDDGSSDSSAEIVKTYMMNPVIKMLQKQWGGVASARNLGLKNASGKYVFFLDSDDVMIPQALQRISKIIEAGEKEVYVCGSYFELKDGSYHENRMFQKNAFDKSLEFSKIKRLCQNLSSMCIALYKRDFLLSNGLYVEEGITVGEDTDFFFRCLLICKSIELIDQAAFAYRYNPTSVSNSISYKNIRDVMHVCSNRMKDLLIREGCEVDKEQALNFFATKYIHFSIKTLRLKGKEREDCLAIIKKDLWLLSYAKSRIDHCFYVLAKWLGVNFAIGIYNFGVKMRNRIKK